MISRSFVALGYDCTGGDTALSARVVVLFDVISHVLARVCSARLPAQDAQHLHLLQPAQHLQRRQPALPAGLALVQGPAHGHLRRVVTEGPRSTVVFMIYQNFSRFSMKP